MARFIIAILFTILSGCATFPCDDVCQQEESKWDRYDNWGKEDPHANIDP